MHYRLTLLLFFTPLLLAAQPQNLHLANGCAFADTLTEQSLFSFDASEEADRIVAEIVDALGLQKNFVVRSANVQNALATVLGQQRYILYSTAFLKNSRPTPTPAGQPTRCWPTRWGTT